MKILYIRDICDIGTILVSEARRKNIKANVINYLWGDDGFYFKSNYRIIKFFELLSFSIRNRLLNFDIYHFNYPSSTFLPNNKDIILLKKLGKKVFVHYHGDDIRNQKEKEILKKVDGKFVSTPDLEQFVPDAEWVPLPYNIRDMKKRKGWNDTLRIIHAPTDRNKKGTIHILRAIKELKKSYNIDFELIEGKPNFYVMQKMAMADIVIDQIGPGWYGKVTIEALYCGAVSCFYMDPDLSNIISINPFVSITKRNITNKIAELIEDDSLRNELRAKGYKYIEKYHDSKQIMERLIRIYRNV